MAGPTVHSHCVPAPTVERLKAAALAVFDATANPTFWVPLDDARPRHGPWAVLGAFAQAVGARHRGRARCAGVEVWVQVRTSQRAGVNFHYDKDEAARDRARFITPALGTITYCTTGGAPTLLLSAPQVDRQGRPLVGGRPALDDGDSEEEVAECDAAAWCVSPVAGRHVTFPGSWLHAVVPRLRSARAEPGPRVTVLVNLWARRPAALALIPAGTPSPARALRWLARGSPVRAEGPEPGARKRKFCELVGPEHAVEFALPFSARSVLQAAVRMQIYEVELM